MFIQDKIEKLKQLAENIQAAKLEKREQEMHVNSHAIIDEYLEWRTECEDLFDRYFNVSNSQYEIFKSLPRDGNGYALIGYFNQQYPIFKILIKKIESGEVMLISQKNLKLKEPEEIVNDDVKTVFISHASRDKEIVDAFIDVVLHGALNIPVHKIFCTSTDGTKIKSGKDWRDSIKQNLITAKVNFLIITPNYKESEMCLNEMGAAWVTSANVIPLIVEPINYKTIGILHEPNQAEKLLDSESLDRIRDAVQELGLPESPIMSDRWTGKKKEFLIRIKKYISANPFSEPMDRKAFDELLNEKSELEETIENLIEEKKDLENLVTQLTNAKDKTEVEKIIKCTKPINKFQEFAVLCEIVKDQLANYSGIINGILFKTYSGKNITIDLQSNKDELDEAFANDWIDEDINIDWEGTMEMGSIKNALDAVSNFLNTNLDDGFYGMYEEHYDAPRQISNKKFWEDVFEATIRFR